MKDGGTPEQVRNWKRIDIGMETNFAELSPREFEKFIADLFSKMGFQTELGPGVKDFGADIIAKRGTDIILIQVKKYSFGNNVGAQEVQQALGSMWKYKANKAIIITTSDFTIQAQEQAKGAPIELWNQETLFEMIKKYLL
jgi:restriction system protein